MNFKIILFIFLLLNLNNTHVYSMEPDVFVQSTVNRASQILSENHYNQVANIYRLIVNCKTSSRSNLFNCH